MSAPDMKLLHQWRRSQDAEAFNTLVGRYVDLVYGTCRRILRNDADAEEVTQECFIKLATGETVIRSSLGGWLHRLATHGSIDRIRSEQRRIQREQHFAENGDSHVEATWDDIQGHVDAAVDTLPDKLRDPVLRHFIGRETHGAIATSSISPTAATAPAGRGFTMTVPARWVGL